MNLGDLLRAASSKVETVKVVRTAINPLLWLVGLVTPLSLVMVMLLGDLWIRITLLVLGFMPVLFTMAAYFVYMFRDPDRLQSEEYRLRQSALQLLIAKNAEEKVVDAATQIARIENLLGGFSEGKRE